MNRHHTTLLIAFLSLPAAFGVSACSEKFNTCENTLTCSEGGATASGGSSSGGDSGDTGGASSGGSGTGGETPETCTPACADNEKCVNSECVECTSNTDCSGDNAVCDTEAGKCVGCVEQTDCDESAPVCTSDQNCGACTDDDDCSTYLDAKICGAEGACVQCTVGDESACGGNSCNPATSECTTTSRDSVLNCQSCVADSECKADYYCVPMNYDGTPRGGYCLKDVMAGGCEQPYRIDITMQTSLSGVQGNSYCGINQELTTCEAVKALVTPTTCTTDSDCPEAGLCRKVGNGSTKECTYECAGSVQCDKAGNPGATCGPGTEVGEITPNYCGGQST